MKFLLSLLLFLFLEKGTNKFPSLSLKKLDGTKISIPQKNKIIVLNVWATWCVPCIEEMPELNKLVEKYNSDSVEFIAITDESPEKLKAFFEKRTIPFQYTQTTTTENVRTIAKLNLKDFNKGLLSNMDARPMHIIINSNGDVVYYCKGVGKNLINEMTTILDTQK